VKLLFGKKKNNNKYETGTTFASIDI